MTVIITPIIGPVSELSNGLWAASQPDRPWDAVGEASVKCFVKLGRMGNLRMLRNN